MRMTGDAHDARGALAPDAVGLALCVALYGLAVWAPGILFAPDDAPAGLAWFASLPSVAHALGLALFGILGAVRRMRHLPAVLAVASAALWAVAFALCPGCPALLAYVAALVSGLGSAAAFVFWVERIGGLGTRARHGALAAGAAAAAVLSLAAVAPLGVRRACTLALLLAQAAVAARACRVGPPGEGAGGPGAHAGHGPSSTPVAIAAQLAPVVASAVVVTFAAPLVNGVLMLDALPMASRSAISACMGLACAFTLAAAWLLPARPPAVQPMLLAFTALLFAAFIVNWACGLRLSLAVLALASAGYFLVLYLLMEACLAACARFGASVGRVYGVAGCVVMLFRVVADEVSLRLLGAGMAEDTKTLIAMFLMVYLLTCAGFALYHALSRPRGEAAPSGAGEAAGVPAGRSDDAAGEGGERERLDAGGFGPVGDRPGGPTATARPAAGDDPVTLRCRLVAGRQGLSARELEVLVLLMHGRNVPAIAQELSISKNTVQTHVRHIYEALGVHTRQDLVTYVNEAG